MHKHIRIVSIFRLLLALSMLPAATEIPQILVLNSYNIEYSWTEDQYAGIMEALQTLQHEFVVYTEYLDWKRFPNEAHIAQVYNLCKDKYPAKKIDLIITTDDKALEFAIRNRTELFSDAPIVFSGVYRKAVEDLAGEQPNITGVYEDLDIATTLRYAQRIQPDLDSIYLINETTESGQGTERLMVETAHRVVPGVRIETLSDKSIEEMEQTVQTLPSSSIVLIGPFFIETKGRSFNTEVLARRISRASTVPVYTIYQHLFGTGALGGSLLSGKEMGRNAGEMALRILSGEQPDVVRPVGGTNFVTMFDYNAVKRYNIPLSALPAGALFINREPPFFVVYRFESIAILILFLLMTGFLWILGIVYKKTKYIAFYDQLTGLSNKMTVFNTGDKLLALNERPNTAGLLYIDIDNFKYLNDTFGHEFGDKVLISLAATLRGKIGKNVRVAHFGGDEFLVLLLNSGPKEISEYSEDLLSLLGEKMCIDGRELFLTFSTGLALYPEHALQFSELIQNADTAMHRAKLSGKTQLVLYDDTMFHALQLRMEMENGLRGAIERGEMYVMYQPQINLHTGRLDGLEALVRWNHPQKGPVSPADFIPIAEGTGQIEKIGLFVFTSAVRFIKRAESVGHSQFSVSINVSVKQMTGRNFVAQLIGIIEAEGVQAGRITIEVTESVLMEAAGEIRDKLTRLREAGFRIALDDFGTGYSSLTYLRYLPVNYIKMDKSFIDDMFADERSKVLTGSIIQICHDLGLQIVAEGVEMSEQMDFLRQKHCDLIQGYYFSKPGKADDVLEQLELLFL